MIATVPLVEQPDSLWHWSCPDVPGGTLIGHIFPRLGSGCRYCHKTSTQLRDEQQKIYYRWQRTLTAAAAAGEVPLGLKQWCEQQMTDEPQGEPVKDTQEEFDNEDSVLPYRVRVEGSTVAAFWSYQAASDEAQLRLREVLKNSKEAAVEIYFSLKPV